jgi:uncharacterized protein YndB with AHSA1/START domain
MATLSIETAPVTNVLKLSQTRVIRAPRERVYEAWTNPAMLQQWFGSATMHCSGATMDAHVGGKYRIEVAPNTPPPAGADGVGSAAVVGHFTKIVPNELVQFTWSAAWSPEEETLVTVSLKDVAEGTELTLVHERFSTEASRDAHNSGWVGGLDKFTNLLEG